MGYDLPEGSPIIEETPRLIRRWRWRRALWIGALTLVVGLGSVVSATNWLSETLAKPLTLHETPVSSDVIIILGAGTKKSGDHLPTQAKERVQVGLQLYHEAIASRLLMSGGLSKTTGSIEADLMKTYALTQGADTDVVLEETQSTSTRENAEFSLAFMEQSSWQNATVVTSSYHTYRACAVFRKLQGNVRCIAAPLTTIPTDSFSERWSDFRSVVREYGAIVYYKLKGYI